MRKPNVTIALAVALLASAAGCMVLYALYQREADQNALLAEQLEELQREGSRAAVMQSVNAQMEEIATQERRVSDIQREKAERQQRLAEEQRMNAERQRRLADEQRHNAMLAEKKAVEASNLAQRQRTIAEQQRAQAEFSKSVADTLSYIAMGRNLGSLAVTQMTTGNEQLASLLAYAAYVFTARYKGDVYNPTVYEALSLTSASIRKWDVGKGAVVKMLAVPKEDAFLTVNTYGEIMLHTNTREGNLQTEPLFQNSAFDFRDLVADDDGTIYALSHTGHIVFGKPGSLQSVFIEGAQKPFRLFLHRTGELLVVAAQSVHRLNAKTMEQIAVLPLAFKTAVAGEDDRQVLLFDRLGHAYTVDDRATKVTPKPLPFPPQPIMSYTYGWRDAHEAFGTVEGTIFIIDENGDVQRLVGHGSRVSRVEFDGNRLYSASYDGTVRFWPLTQRKTEPVTVIDSRRWVISFIFDETMRYIWTGDQMGSLSETLIDAHVMAERVHDKLKRDFTQEEWDYYVGRNIPYESFTKSKRN